MLMDAESLNHDDWAWLFLHVANNNEDYDCVIGSRVLVPAHTPARVKFQESTLQENRTVATRKRVRD